MTRIVFLLYAEDADLLHEHGAFTAYLCDFKAGQTADALHRLFDVLKTPAGQRAPYLSDALAHFPYTNGGLFAQPIIIPQFSEAARAILLEAARFDWKDISPTIFGAVFESTLNPATRRAGGMHYTSIENIHKVIAPLFLDALEDELNEIAGQRNKSAKTRFEWSAALAAYRQKLASLRIFDPACGSGNFLTETYLRLRKLENRVLQHIHGEQLAIGEFDPIQVSIKQFYGVEINDFAVEVAKTALWIAELQMLAQTRQILANAPFEPLPLKDNANIHCANALRLDWNDVLPASECSYIIGNPPFLGSSVRTKSQTEDMEAAFGEEKKWGKCDYCVGWYRKASTYMTDSCRAAFVSTNSITQGEQVEPTWQRFFAAGFHIDFAYKTFIWDSEATDKAHVHCVIIGFSRNSDCHARTIITASGEHLHASNINGYLIDAPSVFLRTRGKNINAQAPQLKQGNKPVDGGNLILLPEEAARLGEQHPALKQYIKPYIDAQDFLNATEPRRYCLWFAGIGDRSVLDIPEIKDRLNNIREQRSASPTKEF